MRGKTSEILCECPYCGKVFKNYNGLTKHVLNFATHGDDITKEKLLADLKYGGERPLCKCGCGQYTEIAYNGGAHFRDFVQGHQSRVFNNWGHNEKAKLHSAETRREQYKNGGRIQWNKGKSWSETYTAKQIASLMKSERSLSRRKKIREKLKGVPKSEGQLEKLRVIWNSEEFKENLREKIRERISSGRFKPSSMIEGEFIEDCIVPLGVSFERQRYLSDIKHYCDVFVPEKNVIIEFQGDFWHANPKRYKECDLTKIQRKKVEKDKVLREYCSKNDIRLVEVWESEYKEDKDGVIKNLSELLSS